MRIKNNYVIQNIDNEFIVVPVGVETDIVHGVIKLNSSGGFIWNLLSDKDMTKSELEKSLMIEYDIDSQRAAKDVEAFINQLQSIGCIEI